MAEKDEESVVVENDWGKKYMRDALYAQTYLPHDRIYLKLIESRAKAPA